MIKRAEMTKRRDRYKNLSFIFIRTITFAIAWLCSLRVLVYVQHHYIYDIAAPFLARAAILQFPIVLLLYVAFDWAFQQRRPYARAKWALIPSGLFGSFILFIPLLFATIQTSKLVIPASSTSTTNAEQLAPSLFRFEDYPGRAELIAALRMSIPRGSSKLHAESVLVKSGRAQPIDSERIKNKVNYIYSFTALFGPIPPKTDIIPFRIEHNIPVIYDDKGYVSDLLIDGKSIYDLSYQENVE